MKGYFLFDWVFGNDTPRRIDFCFLFKAPGAMKNGDLADAIETSVQNVLFPDVVVIICSKEEFTDVITSFETSELKQAANRTSTKIGLCVCSFNKDGNIERLEFVRNEREGVEDVLRNHIDDVVAAGLAQLFSVPHVSVNAPPGFTFVKPSGQRSIHFLRTEEALTEIERVQFLSFSLLSRISRREKAVRHPIDVIYIDSMAIASVAYALREMYCELFGATRPRVVSFHSHDGLEGLDTPHRGTSLCIISASSSMRLEQAWKEKTHCDPTEVVTLLTLASAKNYSDALYAIPNQTENKTKATETEGVLKDLRITGERFVPEEIAPKKVLLRGPAHSIQTAEEFSNYFRGAEKLHLQARGDFAVAKVRPIYLRGASLMESLEFKKFLSRVLEQKTPASVQAIIYQDDESSKHIAEWCASELKMLMKSRRPLATISQSKLETAEVKIDKTKALLIVAAVIGRGTKLLSISRDLRPIHSGARTYIIGAQIAETQNQITMLGRNLSYSAEKSAIEVKTFASVAVGIGLSDSYIDEHSVLMRLPSDIRTKPVVQERLEKLNGDATGLTANGFLPSGRNLECPLSLRLDFAYWSFKYKEDEINLPAVFLTIAAILQNARETNFESQKDRLGTDAFQQVVLDPENFARYNDGVIQAALLRAAHPGELDYSSERAASRYMLDFLERVFTQHERPQGEAALEFALALRTRRLKLSPDDLEELRQRIQDELNGSSTQKSLLRFLLELEIRGLEESQFPDNF